MGGPFLARTHTPRASARQQQGGGGRIARSISEEGQGSPTLRHAQLRAWGVGPGDLRCPRTGPRRGNANAAARCRDRPCAAARRRHSAAGPAGGACSHTPARVVQQNSGSSRVQPALPPPVRRAGGGGADTLQSPLLGIGFSQARKAAPHWVRRGEAGGVSGRPARHLSTPAPISASRPWGCRAGQPPPHREEAAQAQRARPVTSRSLP